MDIVKKAISDNDIFRVIRSRSFTFMMLSEFFSQFAFNMQHFVIIFLIYGLTHSNTAVSGVILSFTIPAICFSLISGVYVDRWNKKKVLFLTNLIRGILLLPFLITNLHVGLIYTLTFLIAVATQFFLPAEASVIPRLVPKNLILSANSIFSLGIYGTVFAGFILSGPIVLLLGKTYTILLLAMFFFISTFFIFFVDLASKTKPQDDLETENPKKISISFTEEAKEIFSFIRTARRVMHALVVLTISQAIIFVFAVLGPGYVSTILNVQIESLSWILIAPAAVGMGVGAFVLGSIGSKIEGKWLSTIGFVISGIVFLLLPFVNHIVASRSIFHITMLDLVVLLAFIVGIANSLIFIPSNATIQIHTSEHIRGRVYGLLNALIGAVSFLPVILAGGFADIFGVGTVVASIGIVMIILSIIFFVLG